MQGVMILRSLANIRLNITEAACKRIMDCIPAGTMVAFHVFGMHFVQLTPVGATCMHWRQTGLEHFVQVSPDSPHL
jgi:hypothetical protein